MRDAYADCGHMMRTVLLRAHSDVQLTGRDLRVLNAVLLSTISWSKLWHTTTRGTPSSTRSIREENNHCAAARAATRRALRRDGCCVWHRVHEVDGARSWRTERCAQALAGNRHHAR